MPGGNVVSVIKGDGGIIFYSLRHLFLPSPFPSDHAAQLSQAVRRLKNIRINRLGRPLENRVFTSAQFLAIRYGECDGNALLALFPKYGTSN